MNNVEEIKSRLGIEDVVREYVKLSQAGQNWKGLCPFHNEKTPSFMVSSDRQIWHCFGCSEGGDIFTFIMKIEGVEFYEALKILGKKAGVQVTPQNPKEVDLKNKLLDINELAKKFYNHLLNVAPQAEYARRYLKSRGINNKLIDKFELGYSPNSWDTTIKFLKQKRYSDKDIFDAGFTVKKNNGNGYYDRFRNRLMFPVNNIHGQTVGFSARALDKDDVAKYINSPQTAIYNKSNILYGLDKARNDARKKDSIILVEGQMDLISVHGVGSTNSVATSGTALTESQIKILKRYTDNIFLALDTDEAGHKAALRGSAMAAISGGMNVKIITVPDGKDPDECIKDSPDNWFLAIKDAKHYLDYYIDRALHNFDVGTIDGKKSIVSFMDILTRIPNKIEQDYYIKKLSQKLNTDEVYTREELEKYRKKDYNKNPVEVKNTITIKTDIESQIVEEVLSLLLRFPENLNVFENKINPEIFIDKKFIKIYRELLYFYKNNKHFDLNNFINQFKNTNEGIFSTLEVLSLLAEKNFNDIDTEASRGQILQSVTELEKRCIVKQKNALEEKIRVAEESGKDDLLDDLLGDISRLTNKLAELDLDADK